RSDPPSRPLWTSTSRLSREASRPASFCPRLNRRSSSADRTPRSGGLSSTLKRGCDGRPTLLINPVGPPVTRSAHFLQSDQFMRRRIAGGSPTDHHVMAHPAASQHHSGIV